MGSRGAFAICIGVAIAAIASCPVAGAQSEPSHGGTHGGHNGGGPAGGRTAVLIVDHGEPPTYDANTYESFRAFIKHLIEMGVIPSWLESIDTGTILQDRDCYACPATEGGGVLIDAWLGEHAGPAVWSSGFGDDISAHHVLPGGPGGGEPDIYEHGGLTTWHEWQLMGGTSPNYEQKLAKKRVVIRRLKQRYGDRIEIGVGYGIDPRIGGGHEGIPFAIERLLAKGPYSNLVVVYHGVGFSDLMQTHMIRHEIEDSLAALGSELPITYARPIGTEPAFLRSVARKARAELSRLPARAPVAIHLSGHGLPTAECGSYDCGADGYHAQSERLFEAAKAAVGEAIDRPGKTGVFRLYGDGAETETDPEDLVDSPIEALDARIDGGFRYVVDIPYEFDSDSRDTLIVLRQGYERPIPDWNGKYVSEFAYGPLEVRITDASFGAGLKTLALERVARRAIDSVLAG